MNFKPSRKEILEDVVCRTVIILEVIAYLSWFCFFSLVYPLQKTREDNLLISIVVIGSFVVLVIAAFYMDRIYQHRVRQLRTLKSRKHFHKEMEDVRSNWEDIKAQYDIDETTYAEGGDM